MHWKAWNFPWIKSWDLLNNYSAGSTALAFFFFFWISNEWIPCCKVNGPQLVAMLVAMLVAWWWGFRGRPGSVSACQNAFTHFHINEGDIIKAEAPINSWYALKQVEALWHLCSGTKRRRRRRTNWATDWLSVCMFMFVFLLENRSQVSKEAVFKWQWWRKNFCFSRSRNIWV